MSQRIDPDLVSMLSAWHKLDLRTGELYSWNKRCVFDSRQQSPASRGNESGEAGA